MHLGESTLNKNNRILEDLKWFFGSSQGQNPPQGTFMKTLELHLNS